MSGRALTSMLSHYAHRFAFDLLLIDASVRSERIFSDNGSEFRGARFPATIARLGATHSRIHAGRSQTNGNVEALHKKILDECWRPAFARYIYPRYTGLRRELATYLRFYKHRPHPPRRLEQPRLVVQTTKRGGRRHASLTQGRIPADTVYCARKMEANSKAWGQ